jgi:glycosyltransferase involved in cell wall biosynthesis
MRIAIISTPAVAVPPRGYGGTELVVAELAEGLADAGHDVRVFATGDSSVRVRRRALFDTAVWPPSPSHEMAHAAWALRELRREPVDIVHTHTAAALLGGDRADAPVVHTVHHGPDAGLDALYGVCREGCTFVAISEDQRRRLPHAHVVHHGLSADRYAEGAGDAGYAAFLGRYAEEKGAHDAIDAARAAGVHNRLGGR